MGIYFIAAGSASDNRLRTLDTAHAVSDFEPFLSISDMQRLAQNFPSGTRVFLWGANERSRTHLEKVRSDEYVVDFNNQAVAHIFRFSFIVDTTGRNMRLQRYVGWDEGRRSTTHPRAYRYVYFLKSPQVPTEQNKRFFLRAFGKSDKPHFFDGQKGRDEIRDTLRFTSVASEVAGAPDVLSFR